MGENVPLEFSANVLSFNKTWPYCNMWVSGTSRASNRASHGAVRLSGLNHAPHIEPLSQQHPVPGCAIGFSSQLKHLSAAG